MKKLYFSVIIAAGLLVLLSQASYAVNPYQGKFLELTTTTGDIDATTILEIATSIGGFMIFLGGIIAAIVIVVAGLMYMSAGSNQTRVAAAKAVFKNGIIGALIFFASGLIINTIYYFATNWESFFS